MLSLPDFKEKQVLFIRAEQGALNQIRFLNDCIVFSKDGKVVNRISCHKVFAVFVVGDMSITSGLMEDGTKHGISFFFLKDNLETYASINAAVEGHVVLRARQYAFGADKELEMAKKLICDKVGQQIALLKDKKFNSDLLEKQDRLFDTIRNATDAASLRGLEGNASKSFFQAYYKSIGWHRRAPRTKEDIPNVLLDIGYNMLFHCVDSLLRLHGFDTYKGFYHTFFFQRRSLSCDIMEPMRNIIDKELLKIHNMKRINQKDFKIVDKRYILPWSNSKKYSEIFLQAIMDHKEVMYIYIHDYYRYVMAETECEFPEFGKRV